MLSLQASPPMEKKKNKKPFSMPDKNSSMKKRKRVEEEDEEEEEEEQELPLEKNSKHDSFIELNLDTPLPFEWQRCLDIKSGEIHFYNTMTHMRTFKDPRWRPSPDLDLELNLMCEPSKLHGGEVDRADGWGEKEMVATVCGRCHMLVMMWRASPSCPNCRFEHPPGLKSSPALENKPKMLKGLGDVWLVGQ